MWGRKKNFFNFLKFFFVVFYACMHVRSSFFYIRSVKPRGKLKYLSHFRISSGIAYCRKLRIKISLASLHPVPTCWNVIRLAIALPPSLVHGFPSSLSSSFDGREQGKVVNSNVNDRGKKKGKIKKNLNEKRKKQKKIKVS